MKTFSALSLAVAISALTLVGGSEMAMAGKKCNNNISCDQPTAVGKGKKARPWKVLYCVVGKANNRREVDCKSEEAVHYLPTGFDGVCFIGSDDKEHYDFQREVHKNRPFKNLRIKGRGWAVDWQDARPY
jgi:hypothetical protein